VEWIAWPCSDWCRTKGLCSHHPGGDHEEHVHTRLEGYARSNPKKLERILDEIDKRQRSQKYHKRSFGSAITGLERQSTSSDLDAWREKLQQVLSRHHEEEDEDAILDEDEEVVHGHHTENLLLAPLEALPSEILDMIFSHVTVDQTADPYARPFTDLCSCSLVSKNLHAAAVRVMYRHVSIPQSKAFAKFLRSLTEDTSLGPMVQWLDFSHYSNMGFGRARSTSTRTPFLTPTTIKECLDRTPGLQAFLVHEHIDDELDVKVIAKLLRMPAMQALDFTACSSKPFTDAFTTVCTLMAWRDNSMISLGSFSQPLKRLSLHECTTLQEPVFEALLPGLAHLTHLDVAHTLINDTALLSIAPTAQITHLNLERCTRLTGSAVVRFLASHPAAKNTVIYLNLSADSSRHRLLSEEDVSRLLPNLPPTLRSLNIGGARVNPTHVAALRELSARIEELGLRSANLGYAADVTRLFGIEDGNDGSHKSTLRYIDLTDIKSVNQMSLSYSTTALTGANTEPLEVIEVGSSVLDELKKRNKFVKNPEWVVRELGRRGWYVRQPHVTHDSSNISKSDDGSRSWKMGARWWGMRKIPMVEQDVGGMYGYFMFKRN
jgi:F-box-like